MPIDPNATIIPDQAEVWLALKSNVSSISSLIPSTVSSNLTALGWEFCGFIDDAKGISLDPAVEVKPFDAFGKPQFRVKLRKGTLKTGFTVLEDNAVTKKIVLPGSSSNKVGVPKDIQVYVLYKYQDDTAIRIWVSLTPAPIEVVNHGGIVDGELSFAEVVVHHTANSANDVFQTLGGTGAAGSVGSGSTA